MKSYIASTAMRIGRRTRSCHRLRNWDLDLTVRMKKDLGALSEREKQTLRLLVAGHDAKSIARHLGLSVHTVNERLREARRKLDVSSSREAARILSDSEKSDPNFLGDNGFGVAGESISLRKERQPDRRQGAVHRVAWLSGGMLIMSLIIAAVVLSTGLHENGATATQSATPPSAAASQDARKAEGADAARQWAMLLDNQRWDESWQTAAALFKSQLSVRQWTATIQPVRQPLGAVASRVLESATKANSLPGAPAGEYEILQFRTSFAQRSGATEIVILVRESSGWKVAGYFIR